MAVNIKLKNNPKTKKEIFYDIILDRIIKCEYNANDIITEKGLVDEFGYSKSPIREALLELGNEGYIKSIPRFGYQITDFNREIINEITEFRLCLEYCSLQRFWDKKDLDEVRNIEKFVIENYDPESVFTSTLEYWELNSKFHVKLISLTHNSYLTNRLQKAMDFLGVAFAQTYWKSFHSDIIKSEANCHLDIIKAIMDNDKDKALSLLLEDLGIFPDFEKKDYYNHHKS